MIFRSRHQFQRVPQGAAGEGARVGQEAEGQEAGAVPEAGEGQGEGEEQVAELQHKGHGEEGEISLFQGQIN